MTDTNTAADATQERPAVATDRPELDGERLAVYLNDHLTGAMGGHALARRIASVESDSEIGREARRIAEQIDEDRRSLLGVMRTFGIAPRPFKNVLGLVAERVGRLKPNGTLLRRSPLSTVIELEGLELGIEGKVALWRTLHRLSESDSRIDPAEIERLIIRAGEQFTTAERLRQLAIDKAFTRPPSASGSPTG